MCVQRRTGAARTGREFFQERGTKSAVSLCLLITIEITAAKREKRDKQRLLFYNARARTARSVCQ